jgi:fatty-acid desaturase
MPNSLRLLLLCFGAPALVHMLAGLTWAPLLLFTAVVSYPIMVAAVFVFVVPLHRLFARRQLDARSQLRFVFPLCQDTCRVI